MKRTIKTILNIFSICLILPNIVTIWIERIIAKDSEMLFTLWANCFALLPGIIGVFLRRAYYHFALEYCSLDCHIGFGTVFTHKNAAVDSHVSIGNYAVIGNAKIGKNCQIASRVSITSGRRQHQRLRNGSWSPFDLELAGKTTVSPNVWIGEGAIVMADIGEGSVIGAGAVVTKEIPANVVAAGNPARVVKPLA